MKFTKMQGTGNDYIYVNCFEESVTNPQSAAVRLSDRRFGIGSDGLILIKPSDVADCKMDMYNADGSCGKMCGNGIRCIGKYVYERGLVKKDILTVETLSGIKTLYLDVKNGIVEEVEVNMGPPVLDAAKIPVLFPKERVVGETITIGGMTYGITCVSMGNPHCVTFLENLEKLPIEKLGPCFEHHEMFPESVNTEFIRVESRDEIRMRVWERGSGETWACGTGACASVVACILNEKTGRKLTVHLKGGDLKIRWDESAGDVFMKGKAEFVFDGTVQI